MIIATAGHVDHGKTTLVKSLTGIDTDRLPEEKSRGLSIDLGFAYQSLPENITLGFVDVPGHEKFIRNMLAGVAGIDLGLLVVAADDGIMPQTREHFAILNLLGINQVVVAITRIDRVGSDRILEVRNQIKRLFENAGHQNIEIYPLCAPDNQGVDALKSALVNRAKILQHRPARGYFRMAIDRIFTLKGVGLIVTGMVFDGKAKIDDTLVLSADGSQARIRGIRVHNQLSDQAQAGERCAINIVGRRINENSIKRGDWLMHSTLFASTNRIDVELRVLESETKPLKHWTPTHLHIGSDHLTARVAVLSAGSIRPGEKGLVQLVLEQNAFVLHRDRLVLRDQSAQRTIAGGHVVDPFSPKRGRARPDRMIALQCMNHPDPTKALNALTKVSQAGILLAPFSIAQNLTIDQTNTIVESLNLKRAGSATQERAFSTSQWQNLVKNIEAAVALYHLDKPEMPGASLKDIQLAVKPHVETAILEEVANILVGKKHLGERGKRFHLPSHAIQVSEQDREIWVKAISCLAPQSGSPPGLHQAAEILGIDRKVLEASLKTAVKAGEMVLVAKNRYLPTSYITRLRAITEILANNMAEGFFSVAEFVAHSETGRNFAIDLLEYFDRIGFTERTGNIRRIRPIAATAFGGNTEI